MLAQDSGWDAFVVGKQLRTDYNAFIEANGTGVRAITDCLIDILAWRYLYRNDYASLPFYKPLRKATKAICSAHTRSF